MKKEETAFVIKNGKTMIKDIKGMKLIGKCKDCKYFWDAYEWCDKLSNPAKDYIKKKLISCWYWKARKK